MSPQGPDLPRNGVIKIYVISIAYKNEGTSSAIQRFGSFAGAFERKPMSHERQRAIPRRARRPRNVNYVLG
jgi:hypothetical protein